MMIELSKKYGRYKTKKNYLILMNKKRIRDNLIKSKWL